IIMQQKKKSAKLFDIVIVGGLGHVGLPLGLVFANNGFRVCLYDIDDEKADLVNTAVMPFVEYGAEPILRKVIKNGKLKISQDIKSISDASYVIITIGTPLDEYLNPENFLTGLLNISILIRRSSYEAQSIPIPAGRCISCLRKITDGISPIAQRE
ncbi:MAG: hypothetical protein ACE5EK_07355, partial [Nitrospinales bacterium]